jgi:hypothetical protein
MPDRKGIAMSETRKSGGPKCAARKALSGSVNDLASKPFEFRIIAKGRRNNVLVVDDEYLARYASV